MKKLVTLICLVIASTVLFAKPAKNAQSGEALINEASLEAASAEAQEAYEQQNIPATNPVVKINNEVLPLRDVHHGAYEEVDFYLDKDVINTYSNDENSPRRFTVTKYIVAPRLNFPHLQYFYRNELLAPYSQVKAEVLDRPYRKTFRGINNRDTWASYLPQTEGVEPTLYRIVPEKDSAVFAYYYPETGRFVVIRMVYNYNNKRYNYDGSSYITSYVYEDQLKTEGKDERQLQQLQLGIFQQVEQMPLPTTQREGQKVNI
ncbi:MAG: hypothetical protein IKN49_04490 [Elusimicrobiaceae bacterium]|nr:hypothetical protein [Elusimicrobiaceae bacterium]